jgi:hypothetical protein
MPDPSANRSNIKEVAIEIVLRVFDASRTIYPTDPPLREMSVEGKIYAKTDETDHHGRVIYTEQR